MHEILPTIVIHVQKQQCSAGRFHMIYFGYLHIYVTAVGSQLRSRGG